MSGGDRALTERRLKEAAVRVWARHGFHGASVKMIADAAGANVALINRYFGGKEGLLQTLLEEMIREKQQGQLDYKAEPTLAGEILAYLRFRYRQDMADEDLMRIVVAEVATSEAIREKALHSMTYAADENFRRRLVRLQKLGLISKQSNLTDIFRQISLFSFSCSFIEGIVLEVEPKKTDALMRQFASALAKAHSM